MEPNDPWTEAESFEELLALTARFLAGDPIGFPGWAVDETDEESDELLTVLMAANRAGLLSVASQPGAPFGPGHDGWSWGGRWTGGPTRPRPSPASPRSAASRSWRWRRAPYRGGR